VQQTGLKRDQYSIVELTDPDSLNLGYAEIKARLIEAAAARGDWRKIADYTGGTKTMTAALVLAAIELGWELSLVKGARTDLVQVVPGTEIAGLVNTWEVRARQQAALAQNLFNSHAYASAGATLESLLQLGPLSLPAQRSLRTWVGLCRGFDAWDRFDHQRAAHLLRPYQSQIVPQWIFLKQLTGGMAGSGYEAVSDLLLNAERRASRGRFDDAVARLYRALEMLAQLRLASREPPLSTSRLEVEKLPAGLRAVYRRRASQDQAGEIRLGLLEAYRLLQLLGDPLGAVFAAEQAQLLAVLEKRNHSILAHGLQPVNREAYLEVSALVESFIDGAFAAIKVARAGVQFPRMSFEIGP
jgi:hypothetical protein